MSHREYFLARPASDNRPQSAGKTLERLAKRFIQRGYRSPFVYYVNPATLHALELDLNAHALAARRWMVGIRIEDRRGWMVHGVPVVAK